MLLCDAEPGGTLALDLARTTGIAYGAFAAGEPSVLTFWQLPNVGGEGARYVAFSNALEEALHVLQPCALLMEAPIPLPAHTHMNSSRQQFGLRALAYAEAYRASVSVNETDPMTIRRAILGRANFAKDGVKREVIQWCQRRGWKPPDHNAADAALIWEFYRRLHAGIPASAGPLWSEVYNP